MVPSTLQTELKKTTPFESPHQEALLNLMHTSDLLIASFTRLFKQYGITDTQYNVLGLLRRAGSELPCSELAERMLTRVPDRTRLVDRLVQAKLVTRRRSRTDRRGVWVRDRSWRRTSDAMGSTGTRVETTTAGPYDS